VKKSQRCINSKQLQYSKNEVRVYRILGKMGFYVSQLSDNAIYYPNWSIFESERRHRPDTM
jgi:hypothetical protein